MIKSSIAKTSMGFVTTETIKRNPITEASFLVSSSVTRLYLMKVLGQLKFPQIMKAELSLRFEYIYQ